jgi:undecaprenyl-diphosphatase
MSILHAIILGTIQGLTEFLPISSSAHLTLAPWFFGWQDPGLAFDVFLHWGTLIAVFGYFIGDWMRLLRAGIASIIERKIGFERDRLMFWMLTLATIPAGLAGILLHDLSSGAFRAPLIIAVSLSSVGFLMYWIDGRYPPYRGLNDISMKDAMMIGFAQMFALIPGVSRSGSTMTMGRYLGLNREAAARFSFLLSFPIILAACLFETRSMIHSGVFVSSSGYLIAGFMASLISGILSIHVLLAYLRTADFALFAWYRIGLALVILFWSLITGH